MNAVHWRVRRCRSNQPVLQEALLSHDNLLSKVDREMRYLSSHPQCVRSSVYQDGLKKATLRDIEET